MNYNPQSYSGDDPGSIPGAMQGRVMSIDIVNEAKNWYTAKAAVNTRRPYTPRDSARVLFGQRRNDPLSSRPPSAISISSGIFNPADPDSRPGSAAPRAVKLAPLPRTPTVPQNIEPIVSKIPVPPSKFDSSSRGHSKTRFPRKVRSGGNVPMKAFHPPDSQQNDVEDHEKVVDVDEEESSTECQTPAAALSQGSKAGGININLSQLYSGGDNISRMTEKSHSASSSSSGSSLASRNRSAGASIEETADQATYWNQYILPLLESLEDTTIPREDAYEICKKLHQTLEDGDCLKNLIGRRRSSLLSTLFKQLSSTSSRLHLLCARIILDLQVRHQNLNSLSKMLYKISREKKFDEDFAENDLIPSMLRVIVSFSDPLENYETLVYLTGTFKFLSNSKKVGEKIVVKDGIKYFVSLLSDIMECLKDINYQKKAKLLATDVLIQVTAVLRNLSDVNNYGCIGTNMMSYLFQALHILGKDESLTVNISRILSKFSSLDDICIEILDCQMWCSAILNAIFVHKGCLNVTIRLYFALGNLIAKEEPARLLLHNTKLRPDSANKSVVSGQNFLGITNTILEMYIDSIKNRNNSEQDGKQEDTVNKMVRVIANIAISEIPGEAIACDQRSIKNLMAILRIISSTEFEELIINTLTALNNLSYYTSGTNFITENRIEISKLLINILVEGSMPCMMEAVRVFGNISRYNDVPPLLHTRKIDVMMVTLLDSKAWQMVYSACGVLINVTTKQSNRSSLIKEGIIPKLVDVLKHFAPTEWHVCGVACQLLWNLCDDRVVNSDDADSILQVLHAYLGENAPVHLLQGSKCDEKVIQYVVDSWKSDFYSVAKRLYQKILSQHSQLQPI